MKFLHWQRPKNLLKSLEIQAPDPEFLAKRIEAVERDILLPVKVAVIGVIVYYFYFSGWIGETFSSPEVALEATDYFFRLYVLLNGLGAVLLFNMKRLPLALTQWTVFFLSLVDALFLSALTLITGGFDSLLFWIYLGLIVRNATSVPATASQLVLNICVILCYLSAGIMELYITKDDLEKPAAEPFLLRLIILVLTTVCWYGMQILLEKEREAAEEEREFAVRQEQLRSAGRIAAEIAHQIKNPLGIINNAAYSLRRALREGKGNPLQQVEIIQEEVEKSDRIITRLIGYGKLSEGHVEKMSVTEELNLAIAEVFPTAAEFQIAVHRDYEAHLPAVLMQRSHLSEILVNLLQNAREAIPGRGNVWVEARHPDHYSVEVSIRDDGPGISPDKHEKIFEAYYTGKAKGTGLGLSIAKHNAELYGGSVRVESELGKGARFILLFPARTLIKPAK